MSFAALVYPNINPIAFSLGPVHVRWYGLAYLTAFVISFVLLRWAVRRWKLDITDDDLLTVVLAAVIGVVVGARLGYVLFYTGGSFLRHPAEIFAIWDGGMSFHGGLAGVLVAGLVVARLLRIPWLTLCDLGALCAPVGLFLGRIANFVNDELWGRVTTLPWGVVFPGAGPLPRHPSQIYEAILEGIVIFLVMLWLATRKPAPPQGVMLGWLLTLYGVFRIFVEFFRQPDIQIGFLPGGETMGQLLSIPVVLLGIGILVWAYGKHLPQRGRLKG